MKKTSKSVKIIPAMTAAQEQQFWQSADTGEYFDFSRAVRGRVAVIEHLDIAQPITIRLQPSLLNKIKAAARKQDIPYQTYLKLILAQHLGESSSLDRLVGAARR